MRTELGTNFLMDSSRNCFVSWGKAEILEKQPHFCHHPSVTPVCQQSCSLSSLSLHRRCRSLVVIHRYCSANTSNKSQEGILSVRWSGTSEISTATQGKILTLWSPELLLLQCPHLYLFPFGSTAQVMSSEAGCLPQDLPAELAGLFGFCLPWGPSVLHWVMMCREGTQGKSPHLPRPGRRVPNSGPRAAAGRLDHFCSCPWYPAQLQAAKAREALVEWGGILGFGREEEWSPTSSLIPHPPSDGKLGHCCFCFCYFLPCQRNHCD